MSYLYHRDSLKYSETTTEKAAERTRELENDEESCEATFWYDMAISLLN